MKSLSSIKFVIFLVSVTFASAILVNADEIKSPVDRIISQLNMPNSDQVLVVAHRADWRSHPENSISAIKSCIEMGVDMVEVDVRKTKDGVFVLMHDGTVNRTTNGTGKVANFTLKELKQLRLKQGKGGEITDEQVPTLEEVLEVCKGKIMINIDKAGISTELLALMKKTGTTRQILFKSRASVESINGMLQNYKDSARDVFFMPIVSQGGMNKLKTYLELKIKPKAAELVFGDVNSPFNQEKNIRECRKLGLRPWVNTLWASLCAGQTDAKALKEPDKVWGGLIGKGYNMIQTDNPKQLLDYLRSRGLHKFDGRK